MCYSYLTSNIKGGTCMTIQEALTILQDNHITNSVQMLRRWIRQGKIKATMRSRKEGYLVDLSSLNEFVAQKKAEQSELTSTPTIPREATEYPIAADVESYKIGWAAAKENQTALIKQAVNEREKELILKGLKEDTIRYSTDELLTKFPQRALFKKHFQTLDLHHVTLIHLGNWLFDEDFGITLQVDLLPYANRKLKARAKEWYAQELFNHFEENK